ncbi:flagellar assembly protein FliW [Sinomonas albida]|uniref:flagellar assembly protein FliW n=1 Tax=Sinomonas albida TaxID=369942 RepID=UPI0010A921D7|nr:flagellar assembly protein FliW [Sinomonas albida]
MSTLTFTEPLPGLAPYTDYTLDAVDGAVGLFSLRPATAPEVRLFVLDASVYVPHYAPEIAAPCREIGLSSSREARVLVVATPSGDGTTVNLMAPVLVNETTGQSAQAILDGQGWPLREPLGL